MYEDPEFWKWKLMTNFPNSTISDSPRRRYYEICIQSLKGIVKNVYRREDSDPEIIELEKKIRDAIIGMNNIYKSTRNLMDNHFSDDFYKNLHLKQDGKDKKYSTPKINTFSGEICYMREHFKKYPGPLCDIYCKLYADFLKSRAEKKTASSKYKPTKEQLSSIIKRLRYRLKCNEFTSKRVERIVIEDSSKALSSGRSVWEWETLSGIIMTSEMILLIKGNRENNPNIMLYIHQSESGELWHSSSILPELPEKFKDRAKTLGITPEELLESYGLSPNGSKNQYP